MIPYSLNIELLKMIFSSKNKLPPQFLILLFCVLMTAISRGMGETFGVFLVPLSTHFEWNRASITSVYSIYMLSLGFGSLIAGLIFDRFGARFNYLFGTGLLVTSYTIAGVLEYLWQFYLFVGFLGGLGAAMVGIIPAQSLISRWFNTRLASALSIAYAGQGLGTLIMAPAAQFCILWIGWSDTYTYAGLIFLLLLVLISFLPWNVISRGAKNNPRRMMEGHTLRGPTLFEALKTRTFWGFFFIFAFTAFAIFGISLQIVAYLIEQGFSEVESAFTFGIVGMLAFPGMALTGLAADKWPRHIIATISYSLSLIGIGAFVLLQFYPNGTLLTIFTLGFGLSAGARGPIITTLMAELFAGRGLASIYGASNLGQGLGAALGAFSSGILYDITGDYNTGFIAYTFFIFVGTALFWLIRDIRNAKN